MVAIAYVSLRVFSISFINNVKGGFPCLVLGLGYGYLYVLSRLTQSTSAIQVLGHPDQYVQETDQSYPKNCKFLVN